jgi:hypothetical protein
MKKTKTEKDSENNYLKWFLWIAIIIVVIAIVYPIVFWQIIPNWSDAGTFGDSYGALNAVFSGLAFAGVIITIQFQRKELGVQQQELKDTRKEFMVNRITNIIYKQLERFDDATLVVRSDLSRSDARGVDAFIDIQSNIPFRQFIGNSEVEVKSRQENNKQTVDIYIRQVYELPKFAIKANTAVRVVQDAILSSSLPLKDMNELKSLFFGNISFAVLRVMKNVVVTINEYDNLYDSEEICLENLQLAPLRKAKNFLQPIVEFESAMLMSDNIEAWKEKISVRYIEQSSK